MPGTTSNGSQDENDENEEELDESEETQEGSSEESSSNEDPEAAALQTKSSEELAAMVIKLRKENARRRVQTRDAKKAERDAAAKGTPDLEAQLAAEKAARQHSDERTRELAVRSALTTYLADKHPEFVKLAPKIARFVEVDDADLDDDDLIADAVAEAVEDFVKDLPQPSSSSQTTGQPTTASGKPAGGLGRSAGRGSGSDDSTKKKRSEMFPSVYQEPR